MKARLMDRERDFYVEQSSPWNEPALRQDLELDTLTRTMAAADEFLVDVSRKALLTATSNDLATVIYRQEILKDCLKNAVTVREIYNIVVSSLETARREWWGLSSQFPASALYSSNDLLQAFIGVFRKLRSIGEQEGPQFASAGFTSLFAMFSRELNDDYLADVQHNLATLRFPKGVLFGAKLGDTNESVDYVLLKPHGKDLRWFERLLGKRPPGFTYQLDPRDEAGARIVSEMKNRAISRVARSLAQSADHVLSFFRRLRVELAFYIGCLNLHEALTAIGLPVTFPEPRPIGERKRNFKGLYDVCLALRMQSAVVGNGLNAEGKTLIIITGANQGGKSTFLRSIGVAQIMMQCGLFVGAESFTAGMCSAVFTHYKREEDAAMKSGKLDEELVRMNGIVNRLKPHSLLLFNESFAATNEREGSEISRQIVRALLEKGMSVFYVTHLHEFARMFYQSNGHDAVFLRPERLDDGTRTFKLTVAPPLETSHGEDLYRKVFGVTGEQRIVSGNSFEGTRVSNPNHETQPRIS